MNLNGILPAEVVLGKFCSFYEWAGDELNTDRPGFERAAIQKDWEELREFGEQERLKNGTGQMGLL